MIKFEKKIEPLPESNETEENRFERIRKTAVNERHKKSDTDGTRRRNRQTEEDNRLV
jgi:hypothetical protein